jgi:hypothetical protein
MTATVVFCIAEVHVAYSWDTWPREDERSTVGYVGFTNLGATCYLATAMQHLYMVAHARKVILEAPNDERRNRHHATLAELKKMFAYLLVSHGGAVGGCSLFGWMLGWLTGWFIN